MTMPQTPRSAPLTERAAPQRPRYGFFAAVGCLSAIAGLLLGVGGFFAVRALDDGPTVLEQTPLGPDSSIPLGTTFPMELSCLDIEVELTPSTVDWDAAPELKEANSGNRGPEAGNRLILFTVEGRHPGGAVEGDPDTTCLWVWYVAEDGTEYKQDIMVTPRFTEDLDQGGMAADGTFFTEIVLEVPEQSEAGGHLVIRSGPGEVGGGTWVDAA